MREFDCTRFGSCVTEEEEEEENSHLVTVQICQGCIYGTLIKIFVVLTAHYL